MKPFVFGISHKSAPLELVETTVRAVRETPAPHEQLMWCSAIDEVVVLVTCNRVEIYGAAGSIDDARDAVIAAMCGWTGFDCKDFAEAAYVHYDLGAVRHAMSVVSGVDSLVLGESQIQGQFRDAYTRAQEAGTTGTLLHLLMQTALHTGKRVRAEGDTVGVSPSVVSSLLDIVLPDLRPLSTRKAVVVGAGNVASLAAAELAKNEIGDLTILARNPRSAATLAALNRARDGVLGDLHYHLSHVDLLICGTGASHPILTAADFVSLDQPRNPLYICDLAFPRDVESAVANVEGVRLVSIETLTSRKNTQGASNSVASIDMSRVQEIIDDGVAQFAARFARMRGVRMAELVAGAQAR